MAKHTNIGTNQHYPSMMALRMLDAVSRLGNMQKAAEALFVTPSAVSHQLRKLEETVGAKLLQRSGRNIELTSAGNRYVREIRKALDIVQRAAAPLAAEEPFGSLRINCASGFGTYWLSRHIGEFCDLYPNISLNVMCSTDKSDVLSDQVDFSILYGDGSWPGLSVQHLLTPLFFPVCSPRLIEKFGRLQHPEDITSYPLIHHRSHSDWAVWLSAATKKSVRVDRGLVFSDVTHAMNAAIAGNGITIADKVLAGQALEEGKFIRLFETEITGTQAYYIVAREGQAKRQTTRLAIEWLNSKF